MFPHTQLLKNENFLHPGGESLFQSAHILPLWPNGSLQLSKTKLNYTHIHREGDHYVPPKLVKKTAWSWKSFLIVCIPPMFAGKDKSRSLACSVSDHAVQSQTQDVEATDHGTNGAERTFYVDYTDLPQ